MSTEQIYVDQPAVVLTIDGESQSMFYHWMASWSHIMEIWDQTLGHRRDSHVFIRKLNVSWGA